MNILNETSLFLTLMICFKNVMAVLNIPSTSCFHLASELQGSVGALRLTFVLKESRQMLCNFRRNSCYIIIAGILVNT